MIVLNKGYRLTSLLHSFFACCDFTCFTSSISLGAEQFNPKSLHVQGSVWGQIRGRDAQNKYSNSIFVSICSGNLRPWSGPRSRQALHLCSYWSKLLYPKSCVKNGQLTKACSLLVITMLLASTPVCGSYSAAVVSVVDTGSLTLAFHVTFSSENHMCCKHSMIVRAELCREAVHAAECAIQKGDLGNASGHDHRHRPCDWGAQASHG